MINQMNGDQRPAGGERLAGAGECLRVLVADQDGLARSMMQAALHEADRAAIIATTGDGREVLELAGYHRPTVLVLDTALPPEGGVELIGRVLLISPETRVLTVSVDDQQAALAALRAGAVGHIAKDTDPHELARLVVQAAHGETIIPHELIMPMLEVLREAPDRGWRPLHSRLTTREWEIVDLLADGASTKQIVEHLVLSQTTVYTHIKSVLRKLGVHSRGDAVAVATRLRREEASDSRFALGTDQVHRRTKRPPGSTK